MSMCVFFLWKSFSALFASSVATSSSFLDWTICSHSYLLSLAPHLPHQKQALGWVCSRVCVDTSPCAQLPSQGGEAKGGHHFLHSELKAKQWNSVSVMRLFSVLKEKQLWTLKGQDRGVEEYVLSTIHVVFSVGFVGYFKKSFACGGFSELKEQWLLCNGSVSVELRCWHGQYCNCGSNEAKHCCLARLFHCGLSGEIDIYVSTF